MWADLLIPVPPPLCGVLIIGEETIVYCSANAFNAIPIRPPCRHLKRLKLNSCFFNLSIVFISTAHGNLKE
ncbi:hypothetical protein RIF29_38119 [Crotalaria pallida]|uniref:Uncharacterized protein n=1 Tax=Crotalaria pallida TaxID=3830 RepID=A0AAN9E0J3_CROPI